MDSSEAKLLVTSLIHLLGSKLLSEKAARSILGGILWYSLLSSPQFTLMRQGAAAQSHAF